jgi:hypothetical protein
MAYLQCECLDTLSLSSLLIHSSRERQSPSSTIAFHLLSNARSQSICRQSERRHYNKADNPRSQKRKPAKVILSPLANNWRTIRDALKSTILYLLSPRQGWLKKLPSQHDSSPRSGRLAFVTSPRRLCLRPMPADLCCHSKKECSLAFSIERWQHACIRNDFPANPFTIELIILKDYPT